MKHLSAADRERMEELMGELLEKLLLEPAERLRGEKELRRKIQNVEALRDLFFPSGRWTEANREAFANRDARQCAG